MSKRWSAVGATAVVVLSLAACSSSKKSGEATASGSSSTSSGVAAATSYLASREANPTSILVSTPLSKKPAGGKTLIALTNGGASNQDLDAGMKEAAALLGWTVKEMNTGTTPESIQAAMQSAIQQKPDGISESGIPSSIIAKQLQAAATAGIPVSANALPEEPQTGLFDTSIANKPQLATWGKDVAAYVVSKSNGKAKIAIFDLPLYPILHEFVVSFQSNVKTWCPSCTMETHDQQLADIGTKTPSSVVSALQRTPSLNWVVFDLGDLSTGVDAALKAASLSGKVSIGGLTAGAQNVASIKSGVQNAWTGYPLRIVGYRVVDVFARKFNGDDLSAVKNDLLPSQLITPTDVNNIVLDSDGFYAGLSDYQTQFKKLWLVS